MTLADSRSGPVGTRRRMSAERRREQILDVTHAIVDAEGFHAATPTRIAHAAGIDRSLIYQKFGDMGGLFVELIDREAARAGAQFTAAISDLGAADDGRSLVRAFEGVIAAVDAQPATWRLFLFPPQGAPPRLSARLSSSEDVVVAFFVRELLRHDPRTVEPEYTARILHAAGRELLRVHLSDPQAATTERMCAYVRHLSAGAVRAAGVSQNL